MQRSYQSAQHCPSARLEKFDISTSTAAHKSYCSTETGQYGCTPACMGAGAQITCLACCMEKNVHSVYGQSKTFDHNANAQKANCC